MSKTIVEAGWSFILWSKLYLEGWSSRSSYFIGVALQKFKQTREKSYNLVTIYMYISRMTERGL